MAANLGVASHLIYERLQLIYALSRKNLNIRLVVFEIKKVYEIRKRLRRINGFMLRCFVMRLELCRLETGLLRGFRKAGPIGSLLHLATRPTFSVREDCNVETIGQQALCFRPKKVHKVQQLGVLCLHHAPPLSPIIDLKGPRLCHGIKPIRESLNKACWLKYKWNINYILH